MKAIIETLNGTLDAYKPLPFWSWNNKLEVEELKRQVQWMYEKGFGGFFMHARNGLKTEYLSEEWMNCIKVCCDEAKKLGMQAWGYDENGYPSGFVGGKLLQDIENRDMHILPKIGSYDKHADVSYMITGDKFLRVDKEDVCLENETYLNLYLVKNTSTVDILNPAITEQFLQETHEQYKKYLGASFSEILKGFFTDEPEYYRFHTPYSPIVREFFQEQYQEDILDKLGFLFVEKEGYRSFRYRYWTAMQSLMLENFSKKVYDWCNENKILFTGHYIEETSMAMQLWCCGGCMPFYEYEHIPGIDWLTCGTYKELSPRQLGSVVRQLGKKQALTESFAATGWNTSPEELLRIVGFQYACGVNLLCHHLLPYSEYGVRKYDHPTHFSSINPWIEKELRGFNDYVTRLSYLMTEGEEVVSVAVLHPMRSAYLEYKREEERYGYRIGELENQFFNTYRMLSARGIGYHFLDETLLARHGFVRGNTIGCGTCSYQYLIIPPIFTMDSKTEMLIRRYVENGGKILVFGDGPSYLEGEPFDFSYLKSNCNLEEIINAQPYRIENTKTNLYSTYRKLRDTAFLFVQNASDSESYTQTFSMSEDIQSFIALDLGTLKTKQLPLTVSFAKNEGMILFPSKEPFKETQPKQQVNFRFVDANVSFRENAMPVDIVRYSKDGITFSAPIYYSQLFRMLLKERYEGKLYLRYEFEIKSLPNHMEVLAEDVGMVKVNGQAISSYETNKDYRKYDITELIQLGMNVYETCYDWYQSQKLYWILFETDVNSGFRNAMTYDTELQPIYLLGDFGVYSHKPYEIVDKNYICGREFYIDKKPKTISNLIQDGMPFFRGEFTVCQNIELEETNVILKIEGNYLVAKVTVNGETLLEPVRYGSIDISKQAKVGTNEICITYTVGNRNLLGPLHYPWGEGGVGADSFEYFSFRRDEKGMSGYKLLRFYKE